VKESRELWRVQRENYGPWRFTGSLAGRPDLPDPEGTGDPTADPLAALLEVADPRRTGGILAEEFVAIRRLCCLQVPDERAPADLAALRTARGRAIPQALLSRLEAEHSIAVRPRPRLAELRTVDR
jgi:hypothetical protein